MMKQVMKIGTLALAVTALPALSHEAFANRSYAAPRHHCHVAWKGQAQGARIIFGNFSIRGAGTLRCYNTRTRQVSDFPIVVQLGTKALGATAGLSIGRYEIIAKTEAAVGLLTNSPRDLLGSWIVAEGTGAAILGAGAFTAVKVGIPSLQMRLGVQLVRGLGLSVGVSTILIDLDPSGCLDSRLAEELGLQEGVGGAVLGN